MTSVQLSVATVFVPMCLAEPVHERDSMSLNGFSCSDYQLIVELELSAAGECEVDSDCGQVLQDEECVCEYGNAVVRTEYNPSWLYGILDEADVLECTVELGEQCDCDADADMACVEGQCGWL